MKDLKHLIYFENLLEDANNELVRQAQENGSIVLGYTCYHIPEVLLNVDNCISVRLRAPKTGSLDISTYYMSNYTCDYARALVERAIEGGYQFLDAMIGVDACSAMNRSMEHFEVLKVNSKEKFFVTHTDMPLKVTDYYIDSYTTQMREHVLNRLTETFGVDTSDEALRKAVAEHNEVCKIISEIAEMRKLDNPIITGDYHFLFAVFQNLVDNALKYSGDQVKIQITCTDQDAQHVLIQIEDNGFGIPLKNLKHVFERYNRGDHQGNKKIKGHGLGLHYARIVIRAHGGKIDIQSEEGKGTTLFVTLPRKAKIKNKYKQ